MNSSGSSSGVGGSADAGSGGSVDGGTGAAPGSGAQPGSGGEGTAGSGGSSNGTGGGDGIPGPFSYSEYDDEGRLMIDALFLVTDQAYDEIVANGDEPQAFLEPHINELNASLDRSLLTSMRVRSLGVHRVTADDYARTGNTPEDTNTNLDYVYSWLSDYRTTYGADKLLLIAGTEEASGNGAWGGGDASSYFVNFLPVGHEFGHTMGGSHCNDGNVDSLQYGFPLRGYTAGGVPNDDGFTGGTMMCGNSVPIFSNPDLVLTMDQINAYVAEGVLPDQDYVAVLGQDGTLRMGDPSYANMAQVWRDNAPSAARNRSTVRYPGYEDDFYEKDDCVGFYGEEGYGQFFYEICEGESRQDLIDIEVSSIKVGRNVHVNLYSDAEWGAGSTCGGLLQRLPFSSPSLAALSEHHGTVSMDNIVAAASVYNPTDRQAHWRFDGSFEFYGSGEPPFCSSEDGETLTVLRDGSTWSAAAAVMEDSTALPYVIEFDYLSDHEGDDNHADGLTVFFGKDGSAYDSTEPPRENLGFVADGTGYAVAFNIWTNQVSIRDGSYTSLQSTGLDAYTDGAWVPVRVEVRADGITVLYDGVETLTASTPVDATYNGVGVSAGTGAYSADFSVRNFNVSSL